MTKYEDDKEILLHAPDGSIFWDGEDYLDERFCKRYTKLTYFHDQQSSTGCSFKKSIIWDRKDPINTGSLRRLSDIREIVELQEKVALAKVYCDRIIEDLNFAGDDNA